MNFLGGFYIEIYIILLQYMGNKLKSGVNICCQPKEYIIEGNMPTIEAVNAKTLINSIHSEANDFTSNLAILKGK